MGLKTQVCGPPFMRSVPHSVSVIDVLHCPCPVQDLFLLLEAPPFASVDVPETPEAVGSTPCTDDTVGSLRPRLSLRNLDNPGKGSVMDRLERRERDQRSEVRDRDR